MKHVFGVCVYSGWPGSEAELRRNNFIMMEVDPGMIFLVWDEVLLAV